jgi:FMN phosphatase YigB (HAD superfamily)
MPGAGEVMEYLHGKVKLGYITNGMTEVQRPRMEKIEWHKRFDVIVIAGRSGIPNPITPILIMCINKLASPVTTKYW